MDQKLKHLDFIQGSINRLSTNSFLLKGWSVILVSALFVLSGEESDDSFAYLSLVPAVIIWGLDGYFLWQERLYRKLFDIVRVKDADQIDFSMSTADVVPETKGLAATIFSKTLVPFHGAIVGSIGAVVFLVR